MCLLLPGPRPRAAGRDRAEVDGSLVEVPTYVNMKRLLDRAAALARRAGDGR